MTHQRTMNTHNTLALLGFSLIFVGCPSNPSVDASMEFDVPSVGFDRMPLPMDSNSEGGTTPFMDGGDGSSVFMDQRPVDVLDPVTLDVAQIDVNIPMQACALVVPPVAFGAVGRGSRPVYMFTDATGYAIGTHVIRDGAENVWIQRISQAGAATASGNISNLPMGRRARGGSSVREGMFLLTPWSQDEGANELIYFKRTLDNFFEFPGSTQRVTMTGVHRDPQVAVTLRGQMISWKTLNGARSELTAAGIASNVVGAVRTLTDPDEDVGSFRLVASNIAGAHAVVYRDNSMATPRVRYRALLENGSPNGALVDVAAGADLGDVVDAAMDDFGTTWVVWMQSNALRMRRIATPSVLGDGGADAGAAGAGPVINIANTTQGADPAIAMDGANLVVAFRDLSAMPATIVLMRLLADGAQRDRSALAGCVTGGRLAVSTQANSYGVGWVDDLETGAVARVGSVRCR